MLLVAVSFVMKLTYHKPLGIIIMCGVGAFFAILTWEYASTQSKTQISDWLSNPDLMLDTSVVLTVDVALQLVMCVLMARKLSRNIMSRKAEMLLDLTLWFPGLLIFPVLFATIVKMMFSLPGIDFSLIGWSCAAFVVIGIPVCVYLVKLLLRDDDERLELMFLVNGLIAILGVIATVNGRTSASGTNDIDITALCGVIVTLGVGTILGLFINKFETKRQINRITK